MEFFPEELIQKARGRLVSVQEVDNPKEEFLHAWTYQVQHLRSNLTSATEGAHAALKRYLQTSTGNNDLVMTRMTQAVENQAREIEAIISKESIGVPHAF
uniref:AlNc14C42G3539 protein n=1 Tax=Albugo laibachii Nc14 TaxID=890382 RepID=F0W9T5_9STRA|nr:AlNc14C42G3539 [Albugo laibachii Nc14]|eukprot:CCA17903.1 AlNc14C42G3539 [Albugo laibachii Nc14]